MNDELVRASDLVEAQSAQRIQGKQLQETADELGRWKIEIQSEVNPADFSLKLTIRKPNGQGIIKTIPKDDVIYYENDIPSLIEIVTNDIIQNLLIKQIREDIEQTLVNSVRNIVKLSRM
jgi:hypothetical protein